MTAIDLRSDTVTRPTAQMRRVMLDAPVGDDVYGEDPSIAEFEARVADLCGKPAALFCATGSLSNLLGVQTLVAPGTEVLCEASAHIARAEMGAHGALHGVTMRTWVAGRGEGRTAGLATTVQIEELLSPDAGPYLVSTAAVELENTHNFGGGTIQPIEHLREVSAMCRAAGVGLHLDGARLWNAHVETGVPIADYSALFDTVSLCFSKGLGAPVGSVLVGSDEAIAQARVQRKRLGAGWRQAGMLAAAAQFALDHHVDRLVDDHAAARAFAERVALAAPGAVDPERVPTNIVVVKTGSRPAQDVAAAAAAQGVRVSVVGARLVRAVTHLDVDAADCRAAGDVVGRLLAP
ncbi:threonine aldolase family protein [Aestuariimicrobium sp. T2.26MG-19.2B]|uniref:threonine aldolase family protein n=1 Tax=Aestuariimicrobium sp. T2.26MG-19.2B TaxID=3040679 RepID=UPI002477C810|nr:threonine aldolase family protein [Aestuariimicrobium sp. T2.26MG-19.2B]CAI9399608.1 L-allo-threonine aldolase [Aestuariimicrobium sp. T2.26MG-19.2B]